MALALSITIFKEQSRSLHFGESDSQKLQFRI